MIKSIVDYLKGSMLKNGEKKSVVDEKKELSYTELYEQAVRVATYILKLDMENFENRSVAVFMEKGCDAIACFMGIVMSRNIYSPLDANMPEERLNKIMSTLEPELIICDDDHYDDMVHKNFEQRVVKYEEIIMMDPDFCNVERQIQRICDVDPLYVLFTSGSTGIPKGVLINHKSVIDFVEEASEAMDFSEKEKFCNQAPFYFDASVPDIYCTIRNCATLYIPDVARYKFPIKILEYIAQNQINAFFWVPSALVLVANLRVLGKVDISCVKKVMFCGEVMPTKQYNIWKAFLPEAKYVNYYGPCETTYACTYYVIDREFRDDQPLPIGKPCVNTKAIILNERGQQITNVGEVGELYIGGTCLSLGYLNNSEKTSESYVQNPMVKGYRDILYRTGDLVCLNEYGEFMYVGRKDFQIKHMGYRIELGEIETVIGSIKEIEYLGCIYDSKEKMICLFYQGNIGKERLVDLIKTKLPSYMIPQKIVKLDHMIMNANGKVDRITLQEKYEEGIYNG